MTELRELKPGVRSGIGARASRRKKGRRQQEPVEIVETDGTPEGDLRAARSEEAATRQAWNAVLERDQALERPRHVSAADAERLGLEHVYRLDGLGRRTIDRVELEIARARTAREREEAALALVEARQRLAPVALATANVVLAEASAVYAPIKDEVDRERGALEQVFAEFVVRAWRLDALNKREASAWARLIDAAKRAAPTASVRDQIEADSADTLPVDTTENGPSCTIRRAQRRLFGGVRHTSGAGLARLVVAGPRVGRDQAGRRIAAALDEAEQRITDDER